MCVFLPCRTKRSRLSACLRQYLHEGGFPEAVGLEAVDRRELLMSYVDGVILRDVVERYQVGNIGVLRRLVRHLLSNPGAVFSVNKFYNDLRSQGVSVSKDTLHTLLGHLEDAFLIRTVPFFAYSQAQQRVHPRKVYPIDTGFIPFYTAPRPFPVGHALETCVLLELLRRKMEVSYLRTASGYEVDFVAFSPDGAVLLIQACADLSDSATHAREVRALLDAAAQFPNASLHIITLETAPPPDAHPAIQYHNAAAWLLGES